MEDRENELLTEYRTKISKIHLYATNYIESINETIKDYEDDDPIENKNFINELREERQLWYDINRIINNNDNLYYKELLNE